MNRLASAPPLVLDAPLRGHGLPGLFHEQNAQANPLAYVIIDQGCDQSSVSDFVTSPAIENLAYVILDERRTYSLRRIEFTAMLAYNSPGFHGRWGVGNAAPNSNRCRVQLPAMKDLWLAYEGGGTKTRLILATAQGKVLASETGGSSSALYINPKHYARTIRALLKRLRQTAERNGGRVARVGLAAPMDRALVESLVREAFGEVSLLQLGEADIALALYDLSWGVSLVAGTGSSCRFLSRNGTRFSCGGLGPQFGDEGSGYWVGKEAIAAALRAETDQGPATALLDRLKAFYELETMWGILKLCERSGHVAGPRVAACVPVVIECAGNGDVAAQTILKEAGRALGDLVLTTVRKARVKKGPVPLVLTGGLFRAGKLVIAPLKRALGSCPVAFTVYPEAAEPTMGIINILLREQAKGR